MFQNNQDGKQTIDENTDKFNKKILDSILDDDDEQFSQLLSQMNAIDSNPNQPFRLKSYKLPFILSSSPPYACLCAFFSSQKCFDSITIQISEGLNSEYLTKSDNMNRTLAHFACAGGNISIIRELDQSGFDFNVQDLFEKTPSHYCAMFGRIDALKYMWTKGIDILQLKSKMSPIHEACEYGNLEIIKFICENVDKNALRMNYVKNYRHRGNLLHLACQGGYLNIVNYILNNKKIADILINEFDSESRTPLVCSCENGSLECVKALVKFGDVQFNNNRRKKLPIIEAAANGHSDIVQYLLKQKDCNINAMNSSKLTAIEAAIINGRTTVVEILIKNGAIKNFNEEKIGDLFLAACGTYNIEMVKFLDKILNVPYEKMGETFMKQAIKIENKNLVCYLLDKNIKLNDNTCSSINFRAKWTPFMTFLKEKGADFSHLKLSRGDPLIVHSIHECASYSTIKQLISEGVVLDKQIISEYNLLYTVAVMGKADLFNLLSSYKPEIKEVNNCFKSVERLINDYQDYSESKFFNGCLEIAEALLRDYNANPNDSEIVSYAFTHSLFDILELLSQYKSNFSNIRVDCSGWFLEYNPKLLNVNLMFLKDNNIDINKILSENSQPLIVEAIKTGRFNIVQDLIAKGFELNADTISNFNLVYEACFHKKIKLFNFLLSFKPEIKRIKACLLRLFFQFFDSKHHAKNKMKDCLEMIETLFIQYNVDPNNEILINYAIQNKLVEVLDLFTKFNVDFNCCYIDYSMLVSKEFLEVFNHLEKHGCLFRKAKFSNVDIFILPFTYNDENEIDLFKESEEISPIQENIDSLKRSDYDINTLLFIMKYSTKDELIKFASDEKNIIDILLEFKCYNEIIDVFTKLDDIIFPNSCSVDEFKELISLNINMENQTKEAKLLIKSLINDE